MALCIHVVAGLHAGIKDLERVYHDLGARRAQEHGPWAWVIASGWKARDSQLADAAQGLPGPVLIFSTENATHWHMLLVHEGRVQGRFTHDFARVAGVLDEAPRTELPERVDGGLYEEAPWLSDPFFSPRAADAEIAKTRTRREEIALWIDQLQSLRAHLPEDRLERLRVAAEMNDTSKVVQCQAEILLAALDHYVVPHEPARVRPVLLGDEVTDQEFDSDAGNLPRLLAALGLGPYFQEWVRRLVEFEDDFDDIQNEATPPAEQVATLALTSLEGGALTLGASDLPDLYRIIWFCDPDATPILRVETDEPESVRPPDGVTKTVEKGGVVFSFDSPGLLARTPRLLTTCAQRLPENTAFELAAWNSERTAGRQRYAGVISGDTCTVHAAHPPIARAVLEQALALGRTVRGREPMAARSQGELEAVLKAAEFQAAFYTCPPIAEETALRCRGWQRDALALLLFRQRFRHVWNVEEGEGIDRENHEEWLELSALPNGMITVPHSGAVVHEGLTGKFFETDTDAYATRIDKSCKAWDEQMRALGFEHLGDLVAAEIGHVAIRGYAAPDRTAYAALYVAENELPARDFYTVFNEGTSVTTTTLQHTLSLPRSRILVRSSTAMTAASLFQEHHEAIERVEQHGPEPVAIVPTLEGLAQAIDEFLVRRAC
jgi:hypothetical protein